MTSDEIATSRRSPILGGQGRGSVLIFGIPLALIALVAIFAAYLPLANPNAQNLGAALLPPSLEVYPSGLHLLGTDQLGRDLFSRLIFGAQLSLLIGFVSMVIGIVPGAILGLISGYFRGVPDMVIARFVDAQLAIPFVLLAIALIASNGRSIVVLIVVLSLFSWAPFARVVRAETLSLRESTFVLGLRAAGAPHRQIIFRHILPNQAGTLLVMATLQLGAVMLAESALSFLGLGVVSPAISWGAMLAEGREDLITGWWISAFPGIAILITVLLVNLFGDALRTAFDPKTRKF